MNPEIIGLLPRAKDLDPRRLSLQHTTHGALGFAQEKNLPGFSIDIEHESIEWASWPKDLEVLLQIRDIIIETAHLTDKKFRERIPKIQTLLMDSPLFRLLENNPVVNQSELDPTPFLHTILVLLCTKTDGMDLKYVVATRWLAIWHDIGKIFGSLGKEARYHDRLSVLMMWKFFYYFCGEGEPGTDNFKPDFDPHFIQKMIAAVSYHHTGSHYFRGLIESQAADSLGVVRMAHKEIPLGIRKMVTEELQHRFSDTEVATLFGLLTQADMWSTEKYRHLIADSLLLIKEYNPQAYRGLVRARVIHAEMRRQIEVEGNSSLDSLSYFKDKRHPLSAM